MKKILVIIISLILSNQLFCAYLVNVPQTITQPNGATINCFVTGDEFYSWLHDNNNFTIVRNQNTGYYCYAILVENVLVASPYIVGVNGPENSGLTQGINIYPQQIITNTPMYAPASSNTTINNPKNINNIVVYIRFSDQSEFPAIQANYSDMFNNNVANYSSMYNYFKEISYGTTHIVSSFYPINNGTTIISYQDAHTRNFYRPRTIVGDSGFVTIEYPYEGNTRTDREISLLKNALDFVKNQIPTTLNLDDNNDGYIDNICFIIRGNYETGLKDKILWPHQSTFGEYLNLTINNKMAHSFNVQIESYSNVAVFCHEMGHTLGAPDLYHYNDNMTPVGSWDIMSGAYSSIPTSASSYTKFKWMGFINQIPTIDNSGHYTLQPITSSTNNCYKILSSNPNEYFVLEFRQKTGTFETNILGTGLLIYRINNLVTYGNSYGPPDEIYLYRPNGTLTNNGNYTIANFNSANSRPLFNSLSNPNSFLSDGSIENFVIKNITVSGNSISFDVRLCSNTDITFSNTNMLPEVSNAVNTLNTSGSVIIKSTDRITFEAGQEIILNTGFEVQQGGQLDVNIVTCGQ